MFFSRSSRSRSSERWGGAEGSSHTYLISRLSWCHPTGGLTASRGIVQVGVSRPPSSNTVRLPLPKHRFSFFYASTFGIPYTRLSSTRHTECYTGPQSVSDPQELKGFANINARGRGFVGFGPEHHVHILPVFPVANPRQLANHPRNVTDLPHSSITGSQRR